MVPLAPLDPTERRESLVLLVPLELPAHVVLLVTGERLAHLAPPDSLVLLVLMGSLA